MNLKLNLGIVVIIISAWVLSSSCSKQVINIAGLYPDRGWRAPEIKQIGEFAKDLINESPNILPNHVLNITWRRSQCSKKIALESLIELLRDKSTVYHFVYGPACSSAGESIGDIVPSYHLNMITSTAVSHSLTSETDYPNTFLGITTSNNFIVFGIKLIQKYALRRISVIYQDSGLFYPLIELFRDMIKTLRLDVQFDTKRILDTMNDKGIDDILDSIIGRKKYRVVIGLFYETACYRILCRSQRKGYIHPYVTWILPAWYTVNWTATAGQWCESCSDCNIHEATRGALGIDSIQFRNEIVKDTFTTILDKKPPDIWDEFAKNNPVNDVIIEKYLPYSFDSLLSAAIALQNAISEEGINLTNFDYHDNNKELENKMIENAIRKSLTEVNFFGITGNVSYTDKARNSSGSDLFEFVENSILRERCQIAEIGRNVTRSIERTDIVCSEEISSLEETREIVGQLDGVELHSLPLAALVISSILAVCAFVYSVFFLIINFVFYNKKVLKQSSPILNAIILIGTMLQCIVAGLLLFDNRFLGRTPEDNNSNCIGCTILCHLVWWLPALATDLIFGTLIGKAFRVYIIAIRQSFTVQVKVIYIVLFIGAIMLFDTGYTVIWAAIEAIRFQFIAEGPLETANSDITKPGNPFWYIFYCAEGGSPNSPAIAVRFFYILLRWILYGVGLYFAHQIRKVNIRGINEFQSITLATLSTIFFNLVRIILITMIPSVRLIDAAISLLSISYALDTCLIVSFLFVPKLYYIIKDPKEKKVYHGVHNTSEIDYNSINQLMATSKVKEELTRLKSERDTLECEIREFRERSQVPENAKIRLDSGTKTSEEMLAFVSDKEDAL